MPTLDLGDRSLYYELHGDGEPLVCIMGLAANAASWALQIGPFARRHRTLIFDNRDVGRSSLEDGSYEVRDMADDTLALADGLGLGSFHLLGVSMGGAIAQEIALALPERVRTLTLAVTWAGGGAWSRKLAEVWSARRGRMTREEHIDELMLLTLSEQFFENGDAVSWLRQLLLSDPNPQPPEAFARQLHASSRHEARARVGSLRIPIHVIGAEHDLLVPLWKTRELADLIPGARLSVVENAPHGLNVERADEFNRLVLEFIAEHAASASTSPSDG
ncbi:MAG TPA: alpha/beta hydrolase [Thermoleophilaceae bacterium]|nr:alpha/beta hydrolase [Thermoleophilaceae bacterium]